MSYDPVIIPKQEKAVLVDLLCAIIKRELSRPPYDHENDSRSTYCPRCGGIAISKRGHDSTGKQRYQCKTCNRSYTAATNNTFSSTNLSFATWSRFAECHVNGKSLRMSASYCDVSLKTAFYMRKRLIDTIAEYSIATKKCLSRAKSARGR